MSRQETLTFDLPNVRLRNGKLHPPLEVAVTVPDGFKLDHFVGHYKWDAVPIEGMKDNARHELNLPGFYKYYLTDKTTGDTYTGNTMIETAQLMVDARYG